MNRRHRKNLRIDALSLYLKAAFTAAFLSLGWSRRYKMKNMKEGWAQKKRFTFRKTNEYSWLRIGLELELHSDAKIIYPSFQKEKHVRPDNTTSYLDRSALKSSGSLLASKY